MGIVKVTKLIRFHYVIDDPNFSGSDIKKHQETEAISSAIDAYLDLVEDDEFEIVDQSIVIELESHNTDRKPGDATT